MTEVWQQAVDEHVALLRSWRSTNGGYVSGLMLWAARRSDGDMARFRAADGDVDALERMAPLEEITSQDRRTGAAGVAVEQAELVNRAVTWAVTADMVTLVNHAAKTMPLETVERFDVPCPNGFRLLGGTGVQRRRLDIGGEVR